MDEDRDALVSHGPSNPLSLNQTILSDLLYEDSVLNLQEEIARDGVSSIELTNYTRISLDGTQVNQMHRGQDK
jgi:hypothetical protein